MHILDVLIEGVPGDLSVTAVLALEHPDVSQGPVVVLHDQVQLHAVSLDAAVPAVLARVSVSRLVHVHRLKVILETRFVHALVAHPTHGVLLSRVVPLVAAQG